MEQTVLAVKFVQETRTEPFGFIGRNKRFKCYPKWDLTEGRRWENDMIYIFTIPLSLGAE